MKTLDYLSYLFYLLSNIVNDCIYILYMIGIKPEWEDPQNQEGGKWVMELRNQDYDSSWIHTVCALIGEQFTDENEVVGCVFSVRKGRTKLALWTRHETQGPSMRCGAEWKALLGLSPGIKLSYLSHSSAKSGSREPAPKYTL